MKQQYIDLAERCEAAEAGSRELDVLLAIAFGQKNGRDGGFANKHNGDYWVVEECAKCYTTSLDAAMTLLPEGWQIESLSKWSKAPEGADNQHEASSRVCLLETSVRRMGRDMIWGHSSKDRQAEATAKTPTLALLAAICRAMGEG
jgi:hypothetical protein